jgi:hypothetical protein
LFHNKPALVRDRGISGGFPFTYATPMSRMIYLGPCAKSANSLSDPERPRASAE